MDVFLGTVYLLAYPLQALSLSQGLARVEGSKGKPVERVEQIKRVK